MPLINHFLARLDLEARLDRFVPTRDRRVRLPYAKALGVLLRSVLVEREPIYRQYEMVSTFAEKAFGLDTGLVGHVSDDTIGRALDRLFEADRATLLTDVVVAATTEFDVALDELHNDSTTVKFCGQYAQARGRRLHGKRAPFITYGYSKDHRSDLKQLLFILTTSDDGGVPVQFRCDAGNCSDATTHEQSWDALCRATGSVDFLYVADSKLCSRDPMDHIDRHGGRLVTVVPRTRAEDQQFRQWIQTHEPSWELAVDRRNPRRRGGPRDRWWVVPLPHALPRRLAHRLGLQLVACSAPGAQPTPAHRPNHQGVRSIQRQARRSPPQTTLTQGAAGSCRRNPQGTQDHQVPCRRGRSTSATRLPPGRPWTAGAQNPVCP